MTTTKSYDVTYPDAVAGISVINSDMDMKSLEELVKVAGDTSAAVRVVRPTQVAYDYVTVARD